MSIFVGVWGFLSILAWLVTLISGQFPRLFPLVLSRHMLWGVGSGVLLISLHCLIFGIFTGSGKEAKLLAADWNLDRALLRRARDLKMEVFPPALYAIMWVLLTVMVGGAMSISSSYRWYLGLLHSIVAWWTLVYQVKVVLLEIAAVKKNHDFIALINDKVREKIPPSSLHPGEESVADPSSWNETEWASNALALGRFLVFLSWNVWLPFIYLRFAMGKEVPVLGFCLLSAILFGGGSYLKVKNSAAVTR